MKYTILGFQQSKLIENKLTVEDAFILRVIKDMYSSASMEFLHEKGIKYMWINYSYLLEQMPIVGSKRNLMRKIEAYEKKYLLLRVLKKSRKGKRGNFAYISPTNKLDELQDFDLMTESHKGYDKNDIRVMTESHNKDSSIIDSSIKDNKHIPYRKIQHLVLTVDEFNRLNETYSKEDIHDILEQMENWAKLKTKKSAYLTAKQWLKKNKATITAKATVQEEKPWLQSFAPEEEGG